MMKAVCFLRSLHLMSPRGRTTRLFVFILFFFAAALPFPASAAPAQGPVVTLDDSAGRFDMEGRVMVFEDRAARLTAEQALSGYADTRFTEPKSRELNYSFTGSAIWVRFTVENRSRAGTRWLLEIPYPVIDLADLFYRDGSGGISRLRNGDNISYRQRPYPHNHLVFPLTLTPGGTQTYYLRVKSNNSIVIPMRIWSVAGFESNSYDEQVLMGFFYGLLFIMVIYNLTLFLALREPYYLLYSAMTLCIIIYFMALHGHAYTYLWPDWPSWGDLAPVVCLGLASVFLLLFIRKYFGLRGRTPLIDRIILCLAVLVSLLIAASFFIDRLAASVIIGASATLTIILSFLFGCFLVSRRVPHVGAFIATWAIFMIGAMLHAMRAYNIIHYYRPILGMVEVGYAVAQLFFSMSIVYRIDSEKKEKLAAQAELLEKMRQLDETEERFTERLRSDRMKSMSVFSGGIAHDFNNLLTAILGNISISLNEKEIPASARRFLSDAEKASLQAKNLTEQLLAFTKGGEPVRKAVSIADTLSDVVGFSLRGTNVHGELLIENGLWNAMVNEGQVHQVIQNLVLNAREAMPGGGTVTVSARNITVESGNDRGLSPGPYIHITVSDHGIGIPAAQIGEIFSPYFTTKEKGSGLGLAVCYSVVNRHGGHINVKSKPGEGTEFTVYLPACTEPGQEGDTKPPVNSMHGKRVLIMDDEQMVLDIGERMFAKLGFAVTRASNGEDAVGLYRESLESGKAFDAVILDLTVRGGMGGKEAAARIIAMDPGALMVASSGYATDPIMANYEFYGFKGVMPKPYRFEEMAGLMSRFFT